MLVEICVVEIVAFYLQRSIGTVSIVAPALLAEHIDVG